MSFVKGKRAKKCRSSKSDGRLSKERENIFVVSINPIPLLSEIKINEKTMKNLTITFGLAVGLICAVIVYNKVQSNEVESGTTAVAKTIVETDSEGNVTSELTMVISGNRWVEKSKKEYAYSAGVRTETTYDFRRDEWVEVAKVISKYDVNNVLVGEEKYSLANNEWVQDGKKSYNDLSFDDGEMEDMVFDKDGNLLMSATYEWVNGVKGEGVEKNEYVYNGSGMPCRHISYSWNGQDWQKRQVSDLLYVSMIHR